jgi:hypothetical protein
MYIGPIVILYEHVSCFSCRNPQTCLLPNIYLVAPKTYGTLSSKEVSSARSYILPRLGKPAAVGPTPGFGLSCALYAVRRRVHVEFDSDADKF